MRIVSVAFGMCLLALPIQPAFGQPVTESTNPGKPKVYALVAAVGERFSFVHEVRHVDSHLEPYRRSYVDLSDNFLNRSVLRGLDEAIAKIDPDSKRIYLTLAAAQVENVVPSERESVALSKIVAELEKMPQRLEWDRIIVVTPAYKLLEINGMATKLQGFGVFTEPLTGNRIDLGQGETDFAQQGREAVVTPKGKAIQSKTYLAPFSYIEVWVLDPKTLAVIDKQRRFADQKFADPLSGSLDVNQSISKKFLAGRIANLIDESVGEAVMHSEINSRQGEVHVGEPRIVDPADARK